MITLQTGNSYVDQQTCKVSTTGRIKVNYIWIIYEKGISLRVRCKKKREEFE